jgi:hypothetical protein
VKAATTLMPTAVRPPENSVVSNSTINIRETINSKDSSNRGSPETPTAAKAQKLQGQ